MLRPPLQAMIPNCSMPPITTPSMKKSASEIRRHGSIAGRAFRPVSGTRDHFHTTHLERAWLKADQPTPITRPGTPVLKMQHKSRRGPVHILAGAEQVHAQVVGR